MDRIGIIGGTGLIDLAKLSKSLDGIEIDRIDEVLVETKYGEVPLTCIKLSKNAQTKELIFLQRHHNNGKPNMPPHNINHKANISALSDANCEAIVSVCSVGAIAECLPPGKVVLAGQYIDFTGVATSFFDEFAVFTSVTEPFCEELNILLEKVLRKSQQFANQEKLFYTYWLAHGPHFETRAEVDAIEKLGGDMVGMTMAREVKLSNELGIPYSAICISSNWAAGREPGHPGADLNHESVSHQANSKLGPVWDCITELLEK